MISRMAALIVVLLGCCVRATLAYRQPLQPPSLPLPAFDVPVDVYPPITNGRNDFHGWLLLPTVQSGPHVGSRSPIKGYFYHHTPEFETQSPHDFEIMIEADLYLDLFVPNLPLPPQYYVVGTEYVFTPPSFALDQLISHTLTNFTGRFTNGSFDTAQRYLLSNATLVVTNLTTVHYLHENASAGYSELVYLSYPRDPTQSPSRLLGVQHFYFLHLEEKSPDFDQIIHVTIDISSCQYAGSDSALDVTSVGATFVIPSSENTVHHRLSPCQQCGDLPVLLMTDGTRGSEQHTKCTMRVLEEIHCVTVPDSFAKCPPMA